MTGEVLQIHPPKESRNGNIFIRITFKISDGSWAKTDVCPDFRNYGRWKPVIKAGVGTFLRGLHLKEDDEVDADSYPAITSPGEIKIKEKQKEEKEIRRTQSEQGNLL